MGNIKFERLLYKILLLDYIKDDYALEFQNSMVKVTIGTIYLLYGQITFSKNPVLYSNVNWLSPTVWGTIFLVLGSIHIYALFKKKVQLRKNILWIAGVVWLSFSSALLLGDARMAGGYIFLIFALSSFRCYLCVKVFNRFPIHITDQQTPLGIIPGV